MEGALILVLIHGDRSCVRVAADAAIMLVRCSGMDAGVNASQ